MVNSQIKKYILENMDSYEIEAIESQLIKVGFSIEEIEKVYKEIGDEKVQNIPIPVENKKSNNTIIWVNRIILFIGIFFIGTSLFFSGINIRMIIGIILFGIYIYIQNTVINKDEKMSAEKFGKILGSTIVDITIGLFVGVVGIIIFCAIVIATL